MNDPQNKTHDATTGARPPAASAAPRDNSRVMIGVACGLGGAVLGFLVGSSTSKSAANATAATSATSAAPAVVASTPRSAPSASAAPTAATLPAEGPSQLAVDMGAPDRRLALTGPWSDVQLGSRSAARIAHTGTIDVALNPASDPYGLAIVARADEPELEVGVRANEQELGRWKLGTDWKMYSLVVQRGTLKAGVNSIQLVMPPPKGDKAVAMVIDTLHLGPLQMTAYADLAGPNPSGSLIDGYYGREGEGENAQSWSAGKHTRVGLMLKPLNAPYELELVGAAFGPLQPLVVHAEVNGRSAGSNKLDKDGKYVFSVPAGALVSGFNLIELKYDKIIKPSQVDANSKDQRELAIRIGRVAAKPVSTP